MSGASINLSEENAAHIRNSLRMRSGDEIIVCDGRRGDYTAAIEVDNKKITAKLGIKTACQNEPFYSLTVFQALTKADKFETVIQKCAELGAVEIVPVVTERVICLNTKALNSKNKTLSRWQKISESAAKQSGRGIVPQVREITPLGEAMELASGITHCAAAHEKNVNGSLFVSEWFHKISDDKRDFGIFIGPEGGFSDSETDGFINNKIDLIYLGKRILRTETAPIAFASVLLYKYGNENL